MNLNTKKPLHAAVICCCILFMLSSCSIEPQAWTPPAKPTFESALRLNDALLDVEKFDLLGYSGAEEFVSDSAGNIYTGVHASPTDFTNGAILKLTKEGRVEEFVKTDAWVTGMAFDVKGDLLALMNGVGLVKIKDGKIDTLLTHVGENTPILMGTGLKIADDGKVYFANLSATNQSSTKYFNRLILEMKPTGGIYCYDPKTESLEVISEGNYFANGLELSGGEDYLLVSETSKYRILKYWIAGPKKGVMEVFMDNLPGFPNNIYRNPRGDYWIGFTTKRNDQLDNIHPKPGMKKLVYSMPEFLQPAPERFGMVLEVNPKGEVLRALYDSAGKEVQESGAVYEYEGALYLGGDVVSSISKYKLN
jgi:sugar lactone lactonase YvrE